MAEGCAFDDGVVEVVVGGAEEGVAAEGAEASGVGAGAAGDVDGDIEEGTVVRAASEVVFAAAGGAAGGGEIGCGDLVGAVGAVGADAGLLDSGIDGEGRAAGDGGDAEELPSGGDGFVDGAEEADGFEVEVLSGAEGEGVGDVEVGRAFFRVGVEGVLRSGEGDGSGGAGSSDDSADVIERLGPGVSGLDAGATVGDGSGERSL